MRLLRLQVADFGAIERADVALGPGLNVLHGPNDLGKSTLAAALRAVLRGLLPGVCRFAALAPVALPAKALAHWVLAGLAPRVRSRPPASMRVRRLWACQ